jgi:hypothetical protein
MGIQCAGGEQKPLPKEDSIDGAWGKMLDWNDSDKTIREKNRELIAAQTDIPTDFPTQSPSPACLSEAGESACSWE